MSDQSKAEKQLARFSRAYLIKKSSGKSYDYYDGAQMRQMHKWASEEKAAELQPVIDGFKAETISRQITLDAIKDMLPEGLERRARGTGNHSLDILLEIHDVIETQPADEPDSLKDLREANDLSVEFVDRYLRRCGIATSIDMFEGGVYEAEKGSPVCTVLSRIYDKDEHVIVGASKQSRPRIQTQKGTS